MVFLPRLVGFFENSPKLLGFWGFPLNFLVDEVFTTACWFVGLASELPDGWKPTIDFPGAT